MDNFFDEVKKAAEKKVIYTEHALDEMNVEEELISKDEIRQVIFEGEIVEDYPEDKRGHSCLMFAYTSVGRPVHVICSPKEEYCTVSDPFGPKRKFFCYDF